MAILIHYLKLINKFIKAGFEAKAKNLAVLKESTPLSQG